MKKMKWRLYGISNFRQQFGAPLPGGSLTVGTTAKPTDLLS